jgi:hypothetical protein
MFDSPARPGVMVEPSRVSNRSGRWPMTEALREELNRAHEMHGLTAEALVDDYNLDRRGFLFVSFVSLCMSHHKAVMLLVADDEISGSALALARPLVEAVCRGMFVGYEADDTQLEAIENGAEPYPPFKQLVVVLDKRLGVPGFFSQYIETWKSLNDLGHGGQFQLSTRVDENGFVGAFHSEQDLCNLLRGSTSALMRIATAFLGNLKSPEAGESLGRSFVVLYSNPPTIN